MRHRNLTQRLVTRAYASQVPLPPFYRPPPSPPSVDMSSSSEPTLIDGLPIFERKNGKLDALYIVRARHSRPPPDLPELPSTFHSRSRGSLTNTLRTRVDRTRTNRGLTPLVLTVNAVLGSALRPAPVGDGPTTGFFRNVSGTLRHFSSTLSRLAALATRRSSSRPREFQH